MVIHGIVQCDSFLHTVNVNVRCESFKVDKKTRKTTIAMLREAVNSTPTIVGRLFDLPNSSECNAWSFGLDADTSKKLAFLLKTAKVPASFKNINELIKRIAFSVIGNEREKEAAKTYLINGVKFNVAGFTTYD